MEHGMKIRTDLEDTSACTATVEKIMVTGESNNESLGLYVDSYHENSPNFLETALLPDNGLMRPKYKPARICCGSLFTNVGAWTFHRKTEICRNNRKCNDCDRIFATVYNKNPHICQNRTRLQEKYSDINNKQSHNEVHVSQETERHGSTATTVKEFGGIEESKIGCRPADESSYPEDNMGHRLDIRIDSYESIKTSLSIDNYPENNLGNRMEETVRSLETPDTQQCTAKNHRFCCNQRFLTPFQWGSHHNNGLRVKGKICVECKLVFPNIWELKDHRTSFHIKATGQSEYSNVRQIREEPCNDNIARVDCYPKRRINTLAIAPNPSCAGPTTNFSVDSYPKLRINTFGITPDASSAGPTTNIKILDITESSVNGGTPGRRLESNDIKSSGSNSANNMDNSIRSSSKSHDTEIEVITIVEDCEISQQSKDNSTPISSNPEDIMEHRTVDSQEATRVHTPTVGNSKVIGKPKKKSSPAGSCVKQNTAGSRKIMRKARNPPPRTDFFCKYCVKYFPTLSIWGYHRNSAACKINKKKFLKCVDRLIDIHNPTPGHATRNLQQQFDEIRFSLEETVEMTPANNMEYRLNTLDSNNGKLPNPKNYKGDVIENARQSLDTQTDSGVCTAKNHRFCYDQLLMKYAPECLNTGRITTEDDVEIIEESKIGYPEDNSGHGTEITMDSEETILDMQQSHNVSQQTDSGVCTTKNHRFCYDQLLMKYAPQSQDTGRITTVDDVEIIEESKTGDSPPSRGPKDDLGHGMDSEETVVDMQKSHYEISVSQLTELEMFATSKSKTGILCSRCGKYFTTFSLWKIHRNSGTCEIDSPPSRYPEDDLGHRMENTMDSEETVEDMQTSHSEIPVGLSQLTDFEGFTSSRAKTGIFCIYCRKNFTAFRNYRFHRNSGTCQINKYKLVQAFDSAARQIHHTTSSHVITNAQQQNDDIRPSLQETRNEVVEITPETDEIAPEIDEITPGTDEITPEIDEIAPETEDMESLAISSVDDCEIIEESKDGGRALSCYPQENIMEQMQIRVESQEETIANAAAPENVEIMETSENEVVPINSYHQNNIDDDVIEIGHQSYDKCTESEQNDARYRCFCCGQIFTNPPALASHRCPGRERITVEVENVVVLEESKNKSSPTGNFSMQNTATSRQISHKPSTAVHVDPPTPCYTSQLQNSDVCPSQREALDEVVEITPGTEDDCEIIEELKNGFRPQIMEHRMEIKVELQENIEESENKGSNPQNNIKSSEKITPLSSGTQNVSEPGSKKYRYVFCIHCMQYFNDIDHENSTLCMKNRRCDDCDAVFLTTHDLHLHRTSCHSTNSQEFGVFSQISEEPRNEVVQITPEPQGTDSEVFDESKDNGGPVNSSPEDLMEHRTELNIEPQEFEVTGEENNHGIPVNSSPEDLMGHRTELNIEPQEFEVTGEENNHGIPVNSSPEDLMEHRTELNIEPQEFEIIGELKDNGSTVNGSPDDVMEHRTEIIIEPKEFEITGEAKNNGSLVNSSPEDFIKHRTEINIEPKEFGIIGELKDNGSLVNSSPEDLMEHRREINIASQEFEIIDDLKDNGSRVSSSPKDLIEHRREINIKPQEFEIIGQLKDNGSLVNSSPDDVMEHRSEINIEPQEYEIISELKDNGSFVSSSPKDLIEHRREINIKPQEFEIISELKDNGSFVNSSPEDSMEHRTEINTEPQEFGIVGELKDNGSPVSSSPEDLMGHRTEINIEPQEFGITGELKDNGSPVNSSPEESMEHRTEISIEPQEFGIVGELKDNGSPVNRSPEDSMEHRTEINMEPQEFQIKGELKENGSPVSSSPEDLMGHRTEIRNKQQEAALTNAATKQNVIGKSKKETLPSLEFRWSDTGKYPICVRCMKAFSGVRVFEKHRNSNACKKVRRCGKCKNIFDSVAILQHHLVSSACTISKLQDRWCKKCNRAFFNKSNYLRHLRETRCCREYKSPGDLLMHKGGKRSVLSANSKDTTPCSVRLVRLSKDDGRLTERDKLLLSKGVERMDVGLDASDDSAMMSVVKSVIPVECSAEEDLIKKNNINRPALDETPEDTFLGSAIDLIRSVEDPPTIKIEMDEINVAFEDHLGENKDYSKDTTPCSVRLVRLSKDDGRLTERDKLLLSQDANRVDVELDTSDGSAMMSVVEEKSPGKSPHESSRDPDVGSLFTSKVSIEDPSSIQEANRMDVELDASDDPAMMSVVEQKSPGIFPLPVIIESSKYPDSGSPITSKVSVEEPSSIKDDNRMDVELDATDDLESATMSVVESEIPQQVPTLPDAQFTDRDKLLLPQCDDRVNVEPDTIDGTDLPLMSVVESKSLGGFSSIVNIDSEEESVVLSVKNSETLLEEPSPIQISPMSVSQHHMDVEATATVSVVESEIPQSVQMENDDVSVSGCQTTSEVSVEKLNSITNLDRSTKEYSAMEIKSDPQEFDEILKEESFLSIDLGFVPAAKSKYSLQEPPSIEVKHDDDLILESKLNTVKDEPPDIILEPKLSSPRHDSDSEDTELFIPSPAPYDDDPAPRQLSSPEQSSLNDKLPFKCDFCHSDYENVDSLGLHLKTHGIFVHDISLNSAVESETNSSVNLTDSNFWKQGDLNVSEGDNLIYSIMAAGVTDSSKFHSVVPMNSISNDKNMSKNLVKSMLDSVPISNVSNNISKLGSDFPSAPFLSDILNHTNSTSTQVTSNSEFARSFGNAFKTHPTDTVNNGSTDFVYIDPMQNSDPQYSRTTVPITNIAPTSSKGAKKRFAHKPLPATNILNAIPSTPVSTNPNTPTNLYGSRRPAKKRYRGSTISDASTNTNQNYFQTVQPIYDMKHCQIVTNTPNTPTNFSLLKFGRRAKKRPKGSTKSDASTNTNPKYFQTVSPINDLTHCQIVTPNPNTLTNLDGFSRPAKDWYKRSTKSDASTNTNPKDFQTVKPIYDLTHCQIVTTNPNAPTNLNRPRPSSTNPNDSAHQSTTVTDTPQRSSNIDNTFATYHSTSVINSLISDDSPDVVYIDSNSSDTQINTVDNFNSNNPNAAHKSVNYSTSVNNDPNLDCSDDVVYIGSNFQGTGADNIQNSNSNNLSTANKFATDHSTSVINTIENFQSFTTNSKRTSRPHKKRSKSSAKSNASTNTNYFFNNPSGTEAHSIEHSNPNNMQAVNTKPNTSTNSNRSSRLIMKRPKHSKNRTNDSVKSSIIQSLLKIISNNSNGTTNSENIRKSFFRESDKSRAFIAKALFNFLSNVSKEDTDFVIPSTPLHDTRQFTNNINYESETCPSTSADIGPNLDYSPDVVCIDSNSTGTNPVQSSNSDFTNTATSIELGVPQTTNTDSYASDSILQNVPSTTLADNVYDPNTHSNSHKKMPQRYDNMSYQSILEAILDFTSNILKDRNDSAIPNTPAHDTPLFSKNIANKFAGCPTASTSNLNVNSLSDVVNDDIETSHVLNYNSNYLNTPVVTDTNTQINIDSEVTQITESGYNISDCSTLANNGPNKPTFIGNHANTSYDSNSFNKQFKGYVNNSSYYPKPFANNISSVSKDLKISSRLWIPPVHDTSQFADNIGETFRTNPTTSAERSIPNFNRSDSPDVVCINSDFSLAEANSIQNDVSTTPNTSTVNDPPTNSNNCFAKNMIHNNIVSKEPNDSGHPCSTVHDIPQFSDNIGTTFETAPTAPVDISSHSPDVVYNIDSVYSCGETSAIQNSDSNDLNENVASSSNLNTTFETDPTRPTSVDISSHSSDVVYNIDTVYFCGETSAVQNSDSNGTNAVISTDLVTIFEADPATSVDISSHSPDVVYNIDTVYSCEDTRAIQNSYSNGTNAVISTDLITIFETDPATSVDISSHSPDVVYNIDTVYSCGETSAIQNSDDIPHFSDIIGTTFETDPAAPVDVSSHSPVVRDTDSVYSCGETTTIQNSDSNYVNAVISPDLIASNDTLVPNNPTGIDSELPQASDSDFGLHMGPSFTLTDIGSNDFEKIRSSSNVFKCTQCDLQLTTNVEFQEHLRAHTLNQLKCVICDSEFDSKDELTCHSQTHTDYPLYCLRCNVQFKDNYKFRHHLWMHIERIHKCGFCAEQCDNETDLNSHLVNCGAALRSQSASHSVNHLFCERCAEQFDSEADLNGHLVNCGVRDSDFDSKEELKSQSESPSADHLFCKRCNVEFKDNYEFRRHLWKHLYPLTCAVCELTFTELSDLREHIIFEHFSSKGCGFKCTLCSAEVSSEDVLKRHLKSHDPTYKCNKCRAEISSEAELQRHFMIHSCSYKCQQCSAEVISAAELERHIKTHRNAYKCQQCSVKVSSWTELKRHFTKSHRPTYQCSQCSAEVSSEAEVERHLKSHVPTYKCSQCTVEVSGASELFRHFNSHRLIYMCQQCSVEVCSEAEHERHLKSHMPTFKCSHCSAEVSSEVDLNRHLHIHLATYKSDQCSAEVRSCTEHDSHTVTFKCQCSAVVSSAADLHDHVKIHGPAYKCNQCSAEVRSWSENERHLKSHLLSFKCNQCSAEVSSEAQLESHSKSHTPTFKCSQCSAELSSEADLKQHLNLHGPIYKCSLCSAEVRNSTEHERHLKIHRPIYKCNKCRAEVRSESDLDRHLKIHGPIYKCSQCSAEVRNWTEHERHLKSHRPIHKCNQCSAEVSSEAELECHLKSHEPIFNVNQSSAEVSSDAEHEHHLKGHRHTFKCNQCSAEVRSWNDHKRHLKRHGPTYTYQSSGEVNSHAEFNRPWTIFKCSQCSAEVSSEAELKRHLMIHRPTYKCNQCSEEVSSYVDLKRLFESHRPTYRCNQCSAEVNSEAELERHLQSHMPTYKCNQCSAEISSEAELVLHLMSHRTTFKCSQCSVELRSWTEHERHLKTHMPTFKCQECSIEVIGASELHRHFRSHRPAFKCQQCSAKVRSWAEHECHSKRHMPSFKCSKCYAEVGSEAEFERHLKSHRPTFKCSQCSAVVTSDMSLERHSKIHGPTYKCNQCSADGNSEAVYSHRPTYKCSKCSAEVSDEAEMVRHLESHRPIYRCNQCNAEVSSLTMLTNHLKSHRLTYNCGHCSDAVISESEPERHFKNQSHFLKCIQCCVVLSRAAVIESHRPIYKCNQCSDEVSSEAEYERHLKSHTPTFKCSQCNAVVSSEVELTINRPIFECNHCSAAMSSGVELNLHLTSHSPTFKCSQCSAAVSSAAEFKQHLKIHEPSYKCNLCSAEVFSNAELKRHLMRHRPTFKCNQCSADVRSEAYLIRHLKIHEPSFKCHQCCAEVSSEAEFKLHLESHEPASHFEIHGPTCKCGQCSAEVGSDADFERHLKRHSPTYKCQQCRVEVSSEAEFKLHLESHEPASHFEIHGPTCKCGQCSAEVGSDADFERHLKRHRPTYKCQQCRVEVSSEAEFKLHLESHEPASHFEIHGPTCKCGQCSAEVGSDADFERHLKRHRPTYKCQQCRVEVSSEAEFKLHLESHKSTHHFKILEPTYKCHQCSAEVSSEAEFKLHLESHNLTRHFEIHEPSYKCHQCSAEVSGVANLERHLKSHRSTYKCHQCSAEVRTEAELKLHLESHMPTLKCSQCSAEVSSKAELERHFKTHRSTYKCSQCSAEVSTEAQFKLHLEIHKPTRLTCNTCSKSFSSNASLRRHLWCHFWDILSAAI